jgi:Ti-type conjugative transfer relaxase TraA
LAIYHLTANVISRARGQSMVAAAAYRLGVALRDQRYGVTHNYVGKRGVTHSEIMAPAAAPRWAHDREALWNTVEAGEFRKDSQLARLIEVGLPIELSADERVALVRDYVEEEFVAKGMIADFCVRGDPNNPHAHILLTLRALTSSGFGPKERRWNGKSVLLEWRCAWAERVNEHLARAGHAVRIDHRTLAAQQIELMPERRIGVARARQGDGALPPHLAGRIAEQQRIARANGEAILEDPSVALRALTRQRPAFTHQELVQYLRARTQNAVEFDAVLTAVSQSSELVALAAVNGKERFTSRDMIEAEKSLLRRTASMAGRRGHVVALDRQNIISAQCMLSDAAQQAFACLVSEGDAKALAVTGGAKTAILAAASQAWGGEGFAVRGVAPSRRAAASLQAASGVISQSLAACEEEWQGGGEMSRDTVLLLDGAEMLGLKQLERVLAVADRARAKAVFVGDFDQLRAARAESPFQDLMRNIPDSVEVSHDY